MRFQLTLHVSPVFHVSMVSAVILFYSSEIFLGRTHHLLLFASLDSILLVGELYSV